MGYIYIYIRAAAPAADPGKRGKRKGHEQPFNDEDWCLYVQLNQAYSAGDEQAWSLKNTFGRSPCALHRFAVLWLIAMTDIEVL